MRTPLVQAYPLHGDTLTGQLHKSVQFKRFFLSFWENKILFVQFIYPR